MGVMAMIGSTIPWAQEWEPRGPQPSMRRRSRAGRGTALDGLLPDQDEAYQ